MGSRSKVLITVLLVGAVIGVISLQTSNKSLLKGQISRQETPAESVSALPDLKADLVIVAPEEKDGDISVSVTISNLGPGVITGEKPFKYSIYLNNVEVFSNTDSYSTMNAKDSFNFVYPISKAIYNYPSKGNAKVVIDTDERIEEEDEDNNEATVDYFLE